MMESALDLLSWVLIIVGGAFVVMVGFKRLVSRD